MPRTFTLPTIEAVRTATRGVAKTDYFDLHTIMGEFVELARNVPASNMQRREARMQNTSWTNGVGYEEACTKAIQGDLSGVDASDALLAKMEALFPAPTSRHTWSDDVTGAVPNVPAFIAGVPMNMRRRHRVQDEAAPLAIIVDLTSSAGIKAADLHKRGVAILALVRALAGRRPIELWAGCSMGAHNGNATHRYFQIETAPLDLARAAFLLTCPAVPRGLVYGLAEQHYGFKGSWPYKNVDIYRQHMGAILGRAFSHVTETLVVPPVYADDKSITAPVEWISEHLTRYDPKELEAA